MFPSSSRVKLNRASFRDVPGPEAAAPRRKRPARSQEELGDQQPLHLERVPESSGSSSSSEPVLAVSTQQMQPGTKADERNHTGYDHLEGNLRKVVAPSHCTVCGEDASPSPYLLTARKPVLKSCSLKLESPAVECKKKKESTATVTSKKLPDPISHYPKVTLCDIAKSCCKCSHQCGYVLPDILKTTQVTCFKQNMRTGFWLRPSCFGHNKHDCDEKAQVIDSDCCDFKHEKSVTDNQKYPGHNSDSLALSNITSVFHKSWISDNSAASSDSLLPGKHVNDEKSQAGMLEKHVEDSFGPLSDPIGTKFPKKKRVKHNNGLWHRNNCGSNVEKVATKKPLGSRGNPAKKKATKTASKREAQVLKDDPESLTCQRVRVYLGKTALSCARVDMPWPFINRKPNQGALNSVTNGSTGGDDPSASNIAVSKTANQNLPGLQGYQIKDGLQSKETQEEGGDRNGKITSHQDSKDMLRAPLFEKSQATFPSDAALVSTPAWCNRELDTDAVSVSTLQVNGPETDSFRSTPSPSDLCMIDLKSALTLSAMPSPIAQGSPSSHSVTSLSLPSLSSQLSRVKGVCSHTVDKALFHSEETQITSFSSLHYASTPLPDSRPSSDSSVFLLQPESGKELFTDNNAPEFLCNNDMNTMTHNQAACQEIALSCNVPNEHCDMFDPTEFILHPLLSPIISPRRYSMRRNSGHSHEDERDITINQNKRHTACHIPLTVNNNDKDRKVETNYEDLEPVDNRSSEQEVINTKLKTSITSDSNSSPSTDNDSVLSDEELPESRDEMDSNSSLVGSKDDIQADTPVDSKRSVLDEFAAFEQDILLVDVIQDDPDLFNDPPSQTKLKLGPTRVVETPKDRPNTGVTMLPSTAKPATVTFRQQSTTVTGPSHSNITNIKDEDSSRPWRPRCRATPPELQHNKCSVPDKPPKYLPQPDANNNCINSELESQMVSSSIPTVQSSGTGLQLTNSVRVTDYRRQKSNFYCRLYFGDSSPCTFKKCRFQHLPVEGDEKFCIESVARFTKNPLSLQKAGAVFTGYYQNNPIGAHFSMAILLTLLWTLLRAGMVVEIFSILGVSLAQSIVPTHEFLLALFNFVREHGLMSFTPELIRLTFKMATAGLELSLDCLDSVKNAPMFQQMVHSNTALSVSGCHMSLPSTEYLHLAHAILEIELCIKQEDWGRMGTVFKFICHSNQHPLQVERISGHIAIALLADSKDKLSLPFLPFAETVCQSESDDSPSRNFVGRIGVSLMLRYHKTHQWVKGRSVVEVLSSSKISYSSLKSLFGNENGVSRCCLITLASEFFFLSGSVQGTLNTLRENQWFLSSCVWPCEPADLENRSRLLVHVSEKTSLRDALEVLSNLPGIKEPSDFADLSRHSQLFNSHLQACVDRNTLPVAVDTVDFMLSHKLIVDQKLLQMLLHKLGRQNLWLRAREVFRYSLREGYYPGVSAPPEFRTLMVPSHMGEVELALAFEMFITVNTNILSNPAETSGLKVTLTRTQSDESEYLSAGSRLLSAACIPQPKLIVHFNAVNSSQEQIFTLDFLSAQRWLRQNHLWAADIWTH